MVDRFTKIETWRKRLVREMKSEVATSDSKPWAFCDPNTDVRARLFKWTGHRAC